MAGHRNTIEHNVIEDNVGPGIHINGVTDGVVLKNNVIRQPKGKGVLIDKKVQGLLLENNQIDADVEIVDERTTETP